jgi:hypothetical protein
MRKLSFSLALVVILAAAPALFAQCGSINSQSFNAGLTGAAIGNAGLPNGFGNAHLIINGTTGTINTNLVGLGNNITSLQLFQGTPGSSSATLVQTFTAPTSNFQNGHFNRTLTLDPNLVGQIEANPGNFFFVVTTPDFPNGAVAGTLTSDNTQFLTGTLTGSNVSGGSANGSGSFVLSLSPNPGGMTSTLKYDIVTTGIGDNLSGFQLSGPGMQTLPVTIGTSSISTNGRATGTVQINSTAAAAIMQNPAAFSVVVNTPAFQNGAVAGTLGTANEVFIPVAGSVRGVGNTNFMTDLNIFNNSPLGVTGSSASANTIIQFFPSGLAGNANAQNVTTGSISARGMINSHDINTSLFNGAATGTGAIRIISTSPVFANARIFNNQQSNGQGTFGQFVRGLTRCDAETEGLLLGLSNVTSGASGPNVVTARTNVGFFNPNDIPVTVQLELRDQTGLSLGTRTLILQPDEQIQLGLAGASGLFNSVTGDVPSGSVLFLASSPIFVYASEIDNTSGDASFITPEDVSQENR